MRNFEKVVGTVAIILDLLTLLAWGVALTVSMTGNLYGTWKYPAVLNGMYLGFVFLGTSIALFLGLILFKLWAGHSAT